MVNGGSIRNPIPTQIQQTHATSRPRRQSLLHQAVVWVHFLLFGVSHQAGRRHPTEAP